MSVRGALAKTKEFWKKW